MAKFLTDPSFKVGASRHFLMHQDLVYESERYGLRVVEASLEYPFETDFASIPLIVPKWLLNPLGGGLMDRKGRSRLPAVLHDDHCRKALSHAERVEGDKIFRESMKASGTGRAAKNIMYGAVRANTERMKIMGKWRKK